MSQSSRLSSEEREFAERLIRRIPSFRNFSIGLDVDIPGLGRLSARPEYKRKVKEVFRAISKGKKVRLGHKFRAISLTRIEKVVHLNNKIALPKFNVKRSKTMSINVPESSNIDFENLENGSYAAICYGIAVVGTMNREFKGKPKKNLEVRIFFDIPGQTYTYEKDGKEVTRTYTVSHQITFSSSPRGNLCKLLTPWSGGKINKDNIKGFDVETMIGKRALITVESKPDKNDKVWLNLTGITKLPTEMTCKKSEMEQFSFNMLEFDEEKFRKLPKWVMKIVAGSDEFQAMKLRLEDFIGDSKDEDGGQDGGSGQEDDWS